MRQAADGDADGELNSVGERPGWPEPMSVETCPSGVTRRTQWLPLSATYSTPALSIDSPLGAWKAASGPRPSAWRAAPQPASVVTCPSGVTQASECEWYEET